MAFSESTHNCIEPAKFLKFDTIFANFHRICISRQTVKKPRPVMMRHVMFPEKVPGLLVQEKRALGALRLAFDVARNRDTVGPSDRQLIRSRELSAAVPYARVQLGNALWREFTSHFGLSDAQPIPLLPLFYVTPVDIGCMTPINASRANLGGYIRHLRKGLQGLSYVGVVDLSLYASIARGTNSSDQSGINWHLHLFAWGETREEMKARAKRLNKMKENYRPIISRPIGLGFHWQQVSAEDIDRKFSYMCKTPRSAYRIGRTKIEDDQGHENVNFTQGKSALRPGQRLHLFNQMKPFALSEFVVAGGDGVGVRRRALQHIAQS